MVSGAVGSGAVSTGTVGSGVLSSGVVGAVAGDSGTVGALAVVKENAVFPGHFDLGIESYVKRAERYRKRLRRLD